MKSAKNVCMFGVLIFHVGVADGSKGTDIFGAIPPITGGEYSLTRSAVNADYGLLVGGSYRLIDIVGQAEANSTVFVDGFISAASPLESSFVFEDGFER